MAAADYVATVFNRESGEIEYERFAESGLSYFGYRDAKGRLLNRLFFTRRFFARIVGFFLRRRYSKRMIANFVASHRINVTELEKPLSSYESFNEFFQRRLKPGARVIDQDEDAFISPADSKITPYRIEKDLVLPIKGRPFTLSELVGHRMAMEEYEDGLCIVFRLGAGDYHRFCYIDCGDHDKISATGGRLHSVQPFVIEGRYPVFSKNYREICLLKTQRFGEVIQVDVGAMIIGKIVQHKRSGGQFTRGDEKGYFESGSTIVLLLKKRTVVLDKDILERAEQGIETKVKYGTRIGTRYQASTVGSELDS